MSNQNREKVLMDKADIQLMINTLKAMKVEGFDSMYRLVATVEYLEGKLKEEPVKLVRKPEKVDHEFEPLPAQQG